MTSLSGLPPVGMSLAAPWKLSLCKAIATKL